MRNQASYQEEQIFERLLDGGFASSASLTGVAAVLSVASAPGQTEEIGSAAVAGGRLAAVAAASRHGPRMLLLSRSRVVVLGLVALFVMTNALAAVGALPDPVQGVAHNVLDKVGIHVPGPDARAGSHPFERGKSGKSKDHVPGKPSSTKRGDSEQAPSPGPGNGEGKGQSNAPAAPKVSEEGKGGDR